MCVCVCVCVCVCARAPSIRDTGAPLLHTTSATCGAWGIATKVVLTVQLRRACTTGLSKALDPPTAHTKSGNTLPDTHTLLVQKKVH